MHFIFEFRTHVHFLNAVFVLLFTGCCKIPEEAISEGSSVWSIKLINGLKTRFLKRSADYLKYSCDSLYYCHVSIYIWCVSWKLGTSAPTNSLISIQPSIVRWNHVSISNSSSPRVDYKIYSCLETQAFFPQASDNVKCTYKLATTWIGDLCSLSYSSSPSHPTPSYSSSVLHSCRTCIFETHIHGIT